MAKTAKGQKYNDIAPYKRVLQNGTVVLVTAHRRSNPTTSKGERKK